MYTIPTEQASAEINFMTAAANAAQKSRCQKAKCGAMLIYKETIIGTGFNSPAGNEPPRCLDTYIIPTNNKHDFTCCVHAEVRAIHYALLYNPQQISGSTLYFSRLDSYGKQTKAAAPYCTICSKEALDCGVAKFVLWHESGITVYNTQEYNDLSFSFYKNDGL